MVRDAPDRVVSELKHLIDQCREVVAGEAVEHAAAVAADLDESCQPQTAQVLGNRGAGGGHLVGEGAYVLLGTEQAQQVEAGWVGEVAEHVGGHRPLIALLLPL